MLILINTKTEFQLDINELIYIVNQYNKEFNYYLMGPQLLNDDIERNVKKDVILLSCLIVFVFVAYFAIIFRSFGPIIIALSVIFVSIGVSIMLFSILGFKINLISILVLPVVLILSLADSLHMLAGFIKTAHYTNIDKRIEIVISNYIIPSFYSSFTTAFAFFSFFLFNDSEFIRQFGLVTSIALILEFLIAFSIIPYLLGVFNFKYKEFKGFEGISGYFQKWKFHYSIILILFLPFGIYIAKEIKIKTEPSIFFPLNSKTRTAHDRLNKNFYSPIILNLIIKHKKESKLDRNESLLFNETKIIGDKLLKIRNVTHINSATNKFILKSKSGVFIDIYSTLGKENPYYDAKTNTYKIEVYFNKAEEIIEFESEHIEKLKSEINENIEISYYSPVLFMNELNLSITESLLKSFTTSGVAILIMVLILTRSIKITLLSFLPTILPIAVIIILFYLFNINLNLLTSLTLVVGIGILDDDTIHILYRMLWLKKPMGELSFSILSSALLLMIGFAIFYMSNFLPIKTFGILCALIIFIGVLCELTVMQWVIHLAKISKRNEI